MPKYTVVGVVLGGCSILWRRIDDRLLITGLDFGSGFSRAFRSCALPLCVLAAAWLACKVVAGR